MVGEEAPVGLPWPDLGIQGYLAVVASEVKATRRDVRGVREEARLLKEHQATSNSHVNDLRIEQARLRGVEDERALWRKAEAETRLAWEEKADRRFAIGIAAAGLLSGVVFGTITAAIMVIGLVTK